jgi:molybdopterin molybdotransferase
MAGLANQLARSALPAVNLSAMDGYAVAGDGPWWVRGDVHHAGSDGGAALVRGSAVRIATGARVPDGADTVIRDEYLNVIEGPGTAALARSEGSPCRDDVRRRGECWESGALLAHSGTRVSTAVHSTALSAGVDHLTVRGPVRALVVLTGVEIVRDGPRPGHTRDTLGPILPIVLGALDIRCVDLSYSGDSQRQLRRLLVEIADVDVVVAVGSTGRGAADHLRAALAALGAVTLVDGIAMRPGGSQLTAVLPGGRVVLGLPGNPLAAITSLLATGPAIVDALTAREDRVPLFGYLDDPADLTLQRTRLLPVAQQANGRWKVAPSTSTAHLAGLIGAGALAVVPAGCDTTARVELLPFLV